MLLRFSPRSEGSELHIRIPPDISTNLKVRGKTHLLMLQGLSREAGGDGSTPWLFFGDCSTMWTLALVGSILKFSL